MTSKFQKINENHKFGAIFFPKIKINMLFFRKKLNNLDPHSKNLQNSSLLKFT